MFDIHPQTLQYWYKNFLSDYHPDIAGGLWHPGKIETVDTDTGEVKAKPVYVLKKENLGEKMSIDDKGIGHAGFTIFSNHTTGKIALLVESTNAEEVEQAMGLISEELWKVKAISMDMSPTYALVCSNLMPRATQVIDKFHVIKYVYDAVSEVRKNIRKEIANSLTKGKKKTEEDKRKLSEIEHLRRIRHAITQSPDKWTEAMEASVNRAFEQHPNLKTAYQISQDFKLWYTYGNCYKPTSQITKELYSWYSRAIQLKEFGSVIKMIRKHEDEIINYFRHGMTNARAERLNGKIQRFVSSNYGIKDKDFALYRIANYFS